MPNHCSNQFTFTGSKKDIQKLYQQIVVPDKDSKEDNAKTIDFNRIIPMPTSLAIESGSRGNHAYDLLKLDGTALIKDANIIYQAEEILSPILAKHQLQWEFLTAIQLVKLLQNNPTIAELLRFDMKLGQQYIFNELQYGCTTWYDWCMQHWGTKWNAYECIVELSNDQTQLTGYLETAWSPPEPIYQQLATTYPKINMTIHYADEGLLFSGTYQSNGNGNLIDYPQPEDEFKAFAAKHFGWEFEEEEVD